jgi:hypothetical protein
VLLALVHFGLSAVSPGPLDDRIGLAGAFDSTGVYVTFHDSILQPAGARVTMVRPPLVGLRAASQVLRAELGERVEVCPETLRYVGTACYRLRVQTEPEPHQAYVALVGAPDAWRSTEQATFIDVDGDQRLDALRVCASREGLHFTIWAQERGGERRLWHEYFPVYYDMEPTCTDREADAGPP